MLKKKIHSRRSECQLLLLLLFQPVAALIRDLFGLVTATATTQSDGLGVVVGDGGRPPLMIMEKLIEIYRFPITFIHFPSFRSSLNSCSRWGQMLGHLHG